MSRRVRVRERVPVETGAVGTDWFLFFFSHERIKLVSVHLFLFLGFYGFGLGLGFGLLRIEKSRPLPFVSLSLSKERKCAGLFRPLRTSANECTRRPTDRPTRGNDERDALSARREKTMLKISSARSQREKTSPRCGNEKKIETKTRKQTKARVSYLDDGAQTSRGWCNPPGASPDTINRSSRPRLSRANRRCPELRSVTRTPFTANLFGYVSVCELFLSRRRPLATSWWELPQRVSNFLSQRKRGTFSLCACVLLPVSAAPRQIPLRSMDDPPVSLSLLTTTRYSRFCGMSVLFYGERRHSQSTQKQRGCLSLCKVLVLVPFGLIRI